MQDIKTQACLVREMYSIRKKLHRPIVDTLSTGLWVNTHVRVFWQICVQSLLPLLPLFTSKLRAHLFSMLRMATPESLSCDMELLRYVLISFSLENDLSALATVTSIASNNLIAVATVA